MITKYENVLKQNIIIGKFAGPCNRPVLFMKIFVLIIFGHLANQQSTSEYNQSNLLIDSMDISDLVSWHPNKNKLYKILFSA